MHGFLFLIKVKVKKDKTKLVPIKFIYKFEYKMILNE